MSGFRNYLTTRLGKLTVPQIQSPNFLHGISGWRIAKDGSAEFQDIIIPTGSGGAVVTFASSAPASPHTGDLWYDTSNGLQLHQWNGSAWVAYQYGTGSIAASSVVAGLIAVGALDGYSVNAFTINGGTVIVVGTNDGFFVYNGASSAPLNANPNFATGITDWTATSGTATYSTPAYGGHDTLLVTPPAGNGTTGEATSGDVAVTAGNWYLADFILQDAPDGGSNSYGQVTWKDASHNPIGSPVTVCVATPATFTEYSAILQAPAGAAFASLQVGAQRAIGNSTYVTSCAQAYIQVTPLLVFAVCGTARTDPITGVSCPAGPFVAASTLSFEGTGGENAHAQIFANARQLWMEAPKTASSDVLGYLELQSAASGGTPSLTVGSGNELIADFAFFKSVLASTHALTAYQSDTTGLTNAAINAVSDNPNFSAVEVSGTETGRGTVKIAHHGYANGSDANAAAISIDLQTTVGGATGTEAQGIFITSTTDNVPFGNAITVRYNSQDWFVVKGSPGAVTGIVGIGVAAGHEPAGMLEIAQINAGAVGLYMTALAAGTDLIQLKDSGGTLRFQINNAGNTLHRANMFCSTNVIIGSVSSDFGGAGSALTVCHTTDPTTNPAAGHVIIYVDASGNLLARTSAGNVRTIAAV